MSDIEMFFPDGSGTIKVLKSKVADMKRKGYTTEPPAKKAAAASVPDRESSSENGSKKS